MVRAPNTSLSTSNDVVSLQDSGQNVSLDWCCLSVSTKLNVLEHDGMQPGVFPLREVSVIVEGGRTSSLTFLTG